MAVRLSLGASEVDDDDGDELWLPDGDDLRNSMRLADEWMSWAQGGWRRNASVKVVGMQRGLDVEGGKGARPCCWPLPSCTPRCAAAGVRSSSEPSPTHECPDPTSPSVVVVVVSPAGRWISSMTQMSLIVDRRISGARYVQEGRCSTPSTPAASGCARSREASRGTTDYC